MKNPNLYQLFVKELQDMYSAEGLIAESLPRFIKRTYHEELKTAITEHLEETKNHVKRLEKIFSLLDLPSQKKLCKGMEGILTEGKETISYKPPSAITDALIIAAGQRVEHYEIASYGTLCSFAKHLNLQKEVRKLLDENLQEDAAADKKLTKIAEGTFLSTGINEEATESTQFEQTKGQKNKAKRL